MSPDEMLAKHDAQLGTLLAVVTRIDERTSNTHKLVKASSVIGPPHRATLGVSLLALFLAVLALTLEACR